MKLVDLLTSMNYRIISVSVNLVSCDRGASVISLFLPFFSGTNVCTCITRFVAHRVLKSQLLIYYIGLQLSVLQICVNYL